MTSEKNIKNTIKWYCIIDGIESGPIEAAEFFNMVKDGRLKPSDLVWNETMGEQWVALSTISGQYASNSLSPPAVPQEHVKTTDVISNTRGNECIENISCVEPVGPAWRYMKKILFAPFDFGKWFVLGFSAWMASLGQGGGGGAPSFNFNAGNFFNSKKDHLASGNIDFNSFINSAKFFLDKHIEIIITVSVAVFIIGLLFWLFILWLRSRGKFIFLDNVANNRTEISKPWKVFKQQGFSLFKWNIIFSLACFAVLLLFCGITFLTVIMPCIQVKGWNSSAVPGIIFSGILLLIFGVAIGYINRFLEDFIIPIMYKLNLSATQAWRQFFNLCNQHFWDFILYGLFYTVLGMAAGICILLFIIATCCIAGCLMAIPVIGAVVLLPVTVFFRAYSLKYLAQFGAEYTIVVGDK